MDYWGSFQCLWLHVGASYSSSTILHGSAVYND